MDVGKVQFGLPRGVESPADPFAGEGFADMVVAAFMREVSGNRDDFDLLVRRIDQRPVVLAQAPCAGLVRLRGRAPLK